MPPSSLQRYAISVAGKDNTRLSSIGKDEPYRAECVERVGDGIDIGTVELLKDLHVTS